MAQANKATQLEPTCSICGAHFVATPQNRTRQFTCGAKRCSKRADYRRARQRPRFVETNRQRCKRWYAARVARSPIKSGAAGRWFITPHALDRFIARARYDDRENALIALIDESRGAHFVKRLKSGAELWRGPKPHRLRYIVGRGEGDKPALVTVLFAFDRSDP